MEVMRFNSPYRHWITGLLVELSVFVGFVLFAGAVAYIVALIG